MWIRNNDLPILLASPNLHRQAHRIFDCVRRKIYVALILLMDQHVDAFVLLFRANIYRRYRFSGNRNLLFHWNKNYGLIYDVRFLCEILIDRLDIKKKPLNRYSNSEPIRAELLWNTSLPKNVSMRRNCDSGSSINRSPLTTSSCSREKTSNQRCTCRWYMEMDNGRYASFTVPFGSIANSSNVLWIGRANRQSINFLVKLK